MKILILASATFFSLSASAQYYYKDIIGTRETEEMIRLYTTNNVSRVLLTSYDAEKTKSDDFHVDQLHIPSSRTLKTTTRSGVSDASVLTAYYNEKGQVVRTEDSTEALVSATVYSYHANGQLSSVSSFTVDSSKTSQMSEMHLWEYTADEKVNRMLRIKNGTDTTIVRFKLDERGNVIEEQGVRMGKTLDPVYYYYDAQNRLTDIVRFHPKARRLLPEYMFEYSASNQVIQRITIPANNSEYTIWRYQYDEKGLKKKEAVYDRYKQLNGTIEYQYSFGS